MVLDDRGSVATVGATLAGLDAGGAFHWRLRVSTTVPWFPHGRWRQPTGVGRNDTDVRTVKAGDPPDADGDGFDATLDCNEADGSVWGSPSETLRLRFEFSGSEILFDPPRYPGSAPWSVRYDTMRSDHADDFGAGAVCVTQNVSSPVGIDATVPPSGRLFHYLSRAENACGNGSLGSSSDGAPRSGRSCP